MRNPAIVISILFLIGMGHNIYIGDYVEASGGVVGAAIFWGIAYYAHRSDEEFKSFLEFVHENKKTLKKSPALHDGAYITPETEVVSFEYCISLAVVTFRRTSRLFIRGHHNIFARGLSYSVLTLLAGWWAIPLGPYYSVLALIRNLRGGHVDTIRELIEDMEAMEDEEFVESEDSREA